MLVEGPKEPIPTMYFRAPHRDADATHIFPRGKDGMGGVILGGCREKDNWNGEVDLEFAEVIKQKCCALVPQLGKPETLKIIKHGVGLRRMYPVFLIYFPVVNFFLYSQPKRWCEGRA
jgi:D-amino-acid oxidase